MERVFSVRALTVRGKVASFLTQECGKYGKCSYKYYIYAFS